MPDTTYTPKVYKKDGGNTQVVASGGVIAVETGGDITVNGVSLIDEVAALSGLDSGELGVLNGVTPGTVTAGKAVVTTTDKHIDALVISDGGLALGSGAGTAITSTAAELNLLDTSVAGTVVASKAAIYDSAGKLYRSSASPAAAGTLISDATVLTAELNAVTGANGTAGVKLPVAAADEIVVVINTNASNNLLVYPVAGSQINALGASNAFTVTPGQIAVFVGRSATLWYVAAATDTVTGLTASAAELNYNDITTLGTGAASKSVVLDAGEDYTWPATGILTYGVLKDGAGTTLGATAAEINQYCDESAKTEVVTATNVIAATESGKTFFLDAIGGFTSTLPAPALGLQFRFIIKTAPTTAYIITTNAGADILYGHMLERAGTAGVAGAARDTFNFVANLAIVGDWVEFYSDGTNYYYHGMVDVAAGNTVAAT